MTDAELLAIEQRLQQATPGPWTWAEPIGAIDGCHAPTGRRWALADLGGVYAGDREVCDFGNAAPYEETAGSAPSDADAELIAHAPTDLAALLAEVRRLKEIERMYEELQK